jgi:hypothetical protein
MKEKFSVSFLTAGSLAAFVVSAILLASCSADPPREIDRTAEFPGDAAGTALLYVDRNTTITAIDGKKITGRTKIKGHTYVTLAAGQHFFTVKWRRLVLSAKNIGITANLEPNGFYGLTNHIVIGGKVAFMVLKNKGRLPGETPGPGETELIFTNKRTFLSFLSSFLSAEQLFVYLDGADKPFLAICPGETLRVFVPNGSHSITANPISYQFIERTKLTDMGFNKPFEFTANSSPVHIETISLWPAPKVTEMEQ